MMRSARAVATEALNRDSSKPDERMAAERLIAESTKQIELVTSRSPLARLRILARRYVGAVVRAFTRPRNWWDPPEPLMATLRRVDPERWG
jgi:hypothetical protein